MHPYRQGGKIHGSPARILLGLEPARAKTFRIPTSPPAAPIAPADTSLPTFWVAPTGMWRAYVWRTGSSTREVLGDFDTEREAEAATEICWKDGGIESSGRSPLYRLPDGSVAESSELQVGAIYHSEQMAEYYPMPDGLCVNVVLPGGRHWCVDSRADNCDKPDDSQHRCWCRHGNGRDRPLHVDKECEPGQSTCGAGAGSIWVDKDGPKEWHGFCRGGRLVVAT